MTRTAVLGGESGSRGFLGGRMSKSRKWALGVAGAISIVAVMFLQIPGAVIAVLLLSAAAIGTGGQNSLWMKHVARSRIRQHAKAGTDAYRPFDAGEWERLSQITGRAERAGAARSMAAMRQMPSGADGMGWLDMFPGRPGIAWHNPVGESPYLSVVFSVTGQLRGIQSRTAVESAMEAFGRFQAGMGKSTSLATGLQTLTRVLPPDSARHEAWVTSQLAVIPPVMDEDSQSAVRANRARQGQIDALRSYDSLVRSHRRGRMIQRHYVVVTWPIDRHFTAAAALKGSGNDGWRALMAEEIASISRRLTAAREGRVEVLTARQASAVIRHMQHPDWPIDQAADVDPIAFGIAADPVPGAHYVHGVDPDGVEREWYHATAQAVADSIATGPRSGLWLLPVLTGMTAPIIRTISISRLMVPAVQAKRAAKADVTSDQADEISDRKKGRLPDEDTKVRLNAAKRRRADLAPGTGHAGVEYLINVTVSARTAAELAAARRQIAEAFDLNLGIEALEWFDSYQPAASGLTWPIGRGITRPKPSLADRFTRSTSWS